MTLDDMVTNVAKQGYQIDHRQKVIEPTTHFHSDKFSSQSFTSPYYTAALLHLSDPQKLPAGSKNERSYTC